MDNLNDKLIAGNEVILGDEIGVILKGPDDGEYQVSTPTRTTWVSVQLVKALKSSARTSEENKNSSQTVAEKISQTSGTNSERNSSELKTGSDNVKVGEKVKWLTPPGKFGCPSHMEKFNPFEVIEVSPEGVHLELVDPVRWIPFSEIQRIIPTTTPVPVPTPTTTPTTEAEPVEVSVGQWVEIQSGGIYDGQKAQIIGFETNRECLYVLVKTENGELAFKPESLILLG